MQIEKSAKRTAHFSLFHFKLRQHLNKPLKTALFAVDPEKVNLLKYPRFYV